MRAPILSWAFSANTKSWAKQGLLDTRKGLSLRHQPKPLELRLKLLAYSAVTLLRRMIGVDQRGKELFIADYPIVEVSIPIEESLFDLDALTSAYNTRIQHH